MTTLLSGRRILIVEDDYFIASDMKGLLDEEDAVVLGPMATVASGHAVVVSDAPDAAVLDVHLSEGVSYPLADELARRGVPFVFVTGSDAETLPVAYRDIPTVTKPFARTALMRSLTAVLPSSRPV